MPVAVSACAFISPSAAPECERVSCARRAILWLAISVFGLPYFTYIFALASAHLPAGFRKLSVLSSAAFVLPVLRFTLPPPCLKYAARGRGVRVCAAPVCRAVTAYEYSRLRARFCAAGAPKYICACPWHIFRIYRLVPLSVATRGEASPAHIQTAVISNGALPPTDCGVSAKPIEKFRVKRRGAPENNNASKRVFAERENDRRAEKQRKPSENNETELRDERLSLKLSGILKRAKPCGSAKLHRAARKTSRRGKTGKTPAAR